MLSISIKKVNVKLCIYPDCYSSHIFPTHNQVDTWQVFFSESECNALKLTGNIFGLLTHIHAMIRNISDWL